MQYLAFIKIMLIKVINFESMCLSMYEVQSVAWKFKVKPFGLRASHTSHTTHEVEVYFFYVSRAKYVKPEDNNRQILTHDNSRSFHKKMLIPLHRRQTQDYPKSSPWHYVPGKLTRVVCKTERHQFKAKTSR